MINRYYNNLLAVYCRINNTREFITDKYYWLTIQADVETYIKDYDICLASKVVRHKLYRD